MSSELASCFNPTEKSCQLGSSTIATSCGVAAGSELPHGFVDEKWIAN
jgi:hypothetical protein